MPGPHCATLVADVGTSTTKLTLVDLVDDVFRLIAQAETSSTIAAPEADAAQAILCLADTLEGITGRRLRAGDQLLMPPDTQGNGVGALVVTTSAAGALPVVVAALAAQQSVREAVNAARGTYSDIQHVFALDEAGLAGEEWLSRQIAALAASAPAAVVLAGGLEGASVSPMLRVAHVAALLVRRWRSAPRIIYAGNSLAADRVGQILGDTAEIQVVENVRPTTTGNRLEPARSALREMYRDACLPSLPGYSRLQSWGARLFGTVADDQAVTVRFLAERFGRNVLALDIGADHSCGLAAAAGHFSQVVLTGVGSGRGAVQLGQRMGLDTLARWLPYELGGSELQNRLLNRAVRPSSPPATVEELLLEYALVRGAIAATVEALTEARDELQFDLVIAGGTVARAPQPGLAALSLLDMLPLERHANQRFATDLYLDSFGLLAVAGALARSHADAAADLIEHDALNNGPLATVVVPRGVIDAGHQVLEVELTRTSGDMQRAKVAGGQMLRLALPRGHRGTLRIRPSAGIAIGDNAAGAEVLTDEGAIHGSALGIIIDARPRPIKLPEDAEERRRLLTTWLEALDALPVHAKADPGTKWPTVDQLSSPIGVDQPTPVDDPQAADEVPDAEVSVAPAATNTAVAPIEVENQADSEPPMSETQTEPLDPDEPVPGDAVLTAPAEPVEPPKPKRSFFRRR